MLWFRVCTIDKTSWKKSSGYKLRHGKPQKMCTFREWNNEIENQNSKWKTLGYIICATICEQLKCTVFLIQVTDSIAVIVATQFRCVPEWMRKLIILGFFSTEITAEWLVLVAHTFSIFGPDENYDANRMLMLKLLKFETA